MEHSRDRRLTPGTRHIAILAYDGAQSLDIIGPFEVFAMASQYLARKATAAVPAYAVELVSPQGGPVVTISGMTMIAHRATGSIHGGVDTLLVAGGDVRRTLEDRPTLRWIGRMARRVRRLGSVCSGAFILAEVGLLDGRRATTHWAGAALLAQRYPRITVEPDAIFIREGNLYTSAGITAGMDLALALVEEDHGHHVALAVARYLVMFLKRPGGQSQFSTQLALQATPRRTLTDVPEWILEHLDADLSVEALAARAAMSPRNFARVFHRELGVTPAKFVERARVEQARRLLEETTWSLEEVAGKCGFGTAERMRRTFQRHLRVVPHDYRRRFEHAAPGQQSVREGRRTVRQRHVSKGASQARRERKARMTDSSAKLLGVLLYPGFEVLDVFGPVEMFGNLTGVVDVVTVAQEAGPVASAQGPSVNADYGFATCPRLDLLLVPGGVGTRAEVENATLLEWLRRCADEVEVAMTVCTGTALLARTGLLDGRRATTNKMLFHWVAEHGPRVRWIKEARWVEDGKFVTSSGVSAGMDMALAVIARMASPQVSDSLAIGTEYDWHKDPTWDPFAKVHGLV